MARKMRKFSAGGAQGKYDRRMADIKKDFEKDSKGKSGKALEVLVAKRAQRTADAEDDRAKRMGTDRTATRKAEFDAEKNLTRTRKFGADKPVAAAQPAKVSTPEPVKAAEPEKAKPKTFGEAFKAERARLGAGKTFTFNGKSYSTNIAGEGRKAPTPGRTGTGTGASTASSSTNNSAGKAPQSGMSMKQLEASVKADNAKTPPPVTTTATVARNQSAPTPKVKRYETPAEAKARVANLTGNARQLNNLAGVFGVDSVSNARARAQLLAARKKEKARNAERAKGNTPLISGTDTRAFFQYGDAAARSNAAKKNHMAKGGKVKKEKTMKYAKGGSTTSKPPQPTAAERAADAKFRKSVKDLKVTPENAAAIGRGNRSTGMAKGGKIAPKFGAAMKKKSADTKGRAMMKKAGGGKCYASGGLVAGHKSADGIAKKGKTKGKMLAMGGMTGYKHGGKTC
jgi:hypothetical protein